MFKFSPILLIFALLASILSFGPAAAQTQTVAVEALPSVVFKDLKEVDTSEVLEVISPVTMKLANGDIIRLSGIHLTDYTTEHAGPFALTALKILKDMLEGQKVTIYQTKKKDWGRTNRMGHTLAHIERQSDGSWVQGTLVRLGLALVKTSQRTPEMAEPLYALEALAREEKLGIWAENSLILSANEAEQHLNNFHIVEGKILSAALKKNRVYLNFGSNWRDDFTVSIAPEDKRVFSKAQINPLEWNGKTVRVRGWVEDYNGAYIEIDHPEAVEIIEPEEKNEAADTP